MNQDAKVEIKDKQIFVSKGGETHFMRGCGEL